MAIILPSNKILLTKSNDNIDKINHSSENPSVCPSCKGDKTIMTDSKTGEINCSKCGMVLSDKMSNFRLDGRPIVMDETEGKTTTGLLSWRFVWDYLLSLERKIRMRIEIKLNHPCFRQCID